MEHAGRFARGAVYFLRLAAREGELLLKARVVHSAVSQTVPGPGEETILLLGAIWENWGLFLLGISGGRAGPPGFRGRARAGRSVVTSASMSGNELGGEPMDPRIP